MDLSNVTNGILEGLNTWSPKLAKLPEDAIVNKRNNQSRTIKQILGHIYFLKGSLVSTITLGLPCPSTILTFGFLILTKPKFSKYIVIISALWTIVGTSAAFIFGVFPDYFMAVSALIAIIYLMARKKE